MLGSYPLKMRADLAEKHLKLSFTFLYNSPAQNISLLTVLKLTERANLEKML